MPDSANDRDGSDGQGLCPICDRPLIAGPSVDRHHWVPLSRSGRGDAATVHVVCHRMLHRLFTEAELAALYSTPEAIRTHPDMRRFIAWVRRRPADYVDWPQAPRGSGRRPAKRKG